MPLSTRKTGLQVSVFSLTDDYLCDLESATLEVTVSSEDARGVCDEWSHMWAMSRAWKITAEIFVSDAADLLGVAADTAQVTVNFNSGANTYAGTGLITSASHSVDRSSLQKVSVTIEGQGELTVTAPGGGGS